MTSWEDETLVMEKPKRGREMKSREARQISKEESRQSKELYHEGFVGDKKYLVPDSNLIAMRNLVDNKITISSGRRLSRKAHTEDREGDDLYQKKMEQLYQKLQESDESTSSTSTSRKDMGDSEGDSSDTTTSTLKGKEEPPTKDNRDLRDSTDSESATRKETFEKGGEKTSETGSSSEGESPTKDDKDFIDSRDVEIRDEEYPENEDLKIPAIGSESEAHGLKFLISGHFRGDTKPIFIVQQYEGDSPFEHKNSDFSSKKTENNVDILISGKFYRDSILDEENGKPKRLRVKPKSILIDKRSKIYEESFFRVVMAGDVDLELEGTFIKHLTSQLYTPQISFCVRKHSLLKQDNQQAENETPTMVYIASPKHQSPFHETPEKQKVREKKQRYIKKEEHNFKFSPIPNRGEPIGKQATTSYDPSSTHKKSRKIPKNVDLEKIEANNSPSIYGYKKSRLSNHKNHGRGVWSWISSMFT